MSDVLPTQLSFNACRLLSGKTATAFPQHSIMPGTKIYVLQNTLTLSLRWHLQSAKLSHAFGKLGTVSTSYWGRADTLSRLLETCKKSQTGKTAWETEALGLNVGYVPCSHTRTRMWWFSGPRTFVSSPLLDWQQNFYNGVFQAQTTTRCNSIMTHPPTLYPAYKRFR